MNKRLLVTLTCIAGLQASHMHGMQWAKQKLSGWFGKSKTEQKSNNQPQVVTPQQPLVPTPQPTAQPLTSLRESTLFNESTPTVPTQEKTKSTEEIIQPTHDDVPALQEPTIKQSQALVPDVDLKEMVKNYFSVSLPTQQPSLASKSINNSIPRSLEPNMERTVVPWVDIKAGVKKYYKTPSTNRIARLLYFLLLKKSILDQQEPQETTLAPGYDERDYSNIALPQGFFAEPPTRKDFPQLFKVTPLPTQHFTQSFATVVRSAMLFTKDEFHPLRKIILFQQRPAKKLIICMSKEKNDEIQRLGTIQHATQQNYSHIIGDQKLDAQLKDRIEKAKLEKEEINRLYTIDTSYHFEPKQQKAPRYPVRYSNKKITVIYDPAAAHKPLVHSTIDQAPQQQQAIPDLFLSSYDHYAPKDQD